MIARESSRTMKRRSIIALFVIIMAVTSLLAGCSGKANNTGSNTKPPEDTVQTPAEPTTAEPAPIDPPSYIAPLTGLALTTEPTSGLLRLWSIISPRPVRNPACRMPTWYGKCLQKAALRALWRFFKAITLPIRWSDPQQSPVSDSYRRSAWQRAGTRWRQ